MRAFAAALRFQLRLSWRAPYALQAYATAPLLTVVIMAVTEHSGRSNLTAYAIVAPTLMSLWTVALLTAGELISEERALGTLEALVAAPAPLSAVVTGRLLAVTLLALVSFLEAWIVSGAVFGRWLPIHHPWVVATTLAATALAMAGTASIMSPLFVLVSSARTVQNTISYPFYLLGGVLAPVAMLPAWLQPLSRLIFLSWSADLLRDGLHPAPVQHPVERVGAVLALAACGYTFGSLLLRRVLTEVRRTGSLTRT